MGIFSVEILGTFSMVMLICFFTIYLYFNISYQYWKRRGVPYLKPKFPTGNSSSFFRKTKVFPLATMDFYKEIKKRGWKFGGVYTVLRPVLVIVDPALMKNILLTDFQYFIDRGFYYNEKDDPISAHLFALDEKSWKNMRIKLTPTFTSGKMKMMFPAVVQKSRYMVDAIIKCAESNEDVDINEFLAKFTTDVIGDCALGMECNSFTNPQAEFRTAGRKLKKFNGILHLLQVTITSNSPDLALKLGFPAVEKDISDFFRMAVKKGVQYRKDNNVTRPDFFQLLINMMEETKNNDNPFTMDQLVAQVFLFFVAGFDTSSSTMNFALYELAQAPDIQNKLRNEINAVLKKHNDEITYENLKEMQYLQQVLDETMRKYPAVPILQRKCVKDYKMRDSEIVIEKGTAVLIPIISLHMDPDYYPQPSKFDPERFTPEMKQARNPFLHIPFGEGPRNCIGLRFGMMQSKIGLIQILKNFKLSISPNTNMPLQLDRDAFLLKSVETLYLRAERI